VKNKTGLISCIRKSPYLTINIVFFLILTGIFLYSAVFPASNDNYPIRGSLEILKVKNDISTGLSHSFSELMRGRVTAAKAYNVYGPRIFTFFLVQLFMRLLFSLAYLRIDKAAILVYLDIMLSFIFFLIFFLPFLIRFYEMLTALF
jgi:hypothetical protein